MWWLILLLSIGIVNAILSFISFYYLGPYARGGQIKQNFSFEPDSDCFTPDSLDSFWYSGRSLVFKDYTSPTRERVMFAFGHILMTFTFVGGFFAFPIALIMAIAAKRGSKKAEFETGDIKVKEKALQKDKNE